MLYVCLAIVACVAVGIVGLVISVIDIDRYNFGLYLSLVSIVGLIIAIALYVVKPDACKGPLWFQRISTRMGSTLSRSFSVGSQRSEPFSLFFHETFLKIRIVFRVRRFAQQSFNFRSGNRPQLRAQESTQQPFKKTLIGPYLGRNFLNDEEAAFLEEHLPLLDGQAQSRVSHSYLFILR